VGGRLGAALGPEAFRKCWKRFSGETDLNQSLVDLGDVPVGQSDVSKNHEEASEWVARAHRSAEISVVVGGGHDHGFSHLVGIKKALSEKKKNFRLGCINIDAHFDLRKPAPKISSGSPFYLALESGTIDASRLVEFGIQR